MPEKADIAVIGLSVMGQNLIMNMSDKGFKVVAYNRTVSRVDDFIKGPAQGRDTIIGVYSLEELVMNLKTPRKIMLMVKAGVVVDDFIEKLIPLLQQGDVLIDGGNSNFRDTMRRYAYLKEKGIYFSGTGISGGEDGARYGPSIMPGGDPRAWPLIKDILTKISAKTADNVPCCDWVGEGGAGHFVKMIHNGIEYGDMQLIGESYAILKNVLNLSASGIQTVFHEWNKGELNSYLIEITADIFGHADDDGEPLVDKILDVAAQKGTGKWTGTNALEMDVPLTLITEAVYARNLSAMKDERVAASEIYKTTSRSFNGDKKEFIDNLGQALLASKIISYTQGFMLLQRAEQEFGWHLNFGSIALLWREGCIIRSAFLTRIKEAYDTNPALQSLLMDPYFSAVIKKAEAGWRNTVSHAVLSAVPVPALSAALAFFDGYRSASLPANLLQAQRDYFGAHTYQRIDRNKNAIFHTNWTRG